jgi:hypothetical protein
MRAQNGQNRYPTLVGIFRGPPPTSKQSHVLGSEYSDFFILVVHEGTKFFVVFPLPVCRHLSSSTNPRDSQLRTHGARQCCHAPLIPIRSPVAPKYACVGGSLTVASKRSSIRPGILMKALTHSSTACLWSSLLSSSLCFPSLSHLHARRTPRPHTVSHYLYSCLLLLFYCTPL